MRVRFFSDKDNWTADGAKITSPDNPVNIQKVFEDEAPIIVGHWFYPGSSSPNRIFLGSPTENARMSENRVPQKGAY
jgi:hypothetical protein